MFVKLAKGLANFFVDTSVGSPDVPLVRLGRLLGVASNLAKCESPAGGTTR